MQEGQGRRVPSLMDLCLASALTGKISLQPVVSPGFVADGLESGNFGLKMDDRSGCGTLAADHSHDHPPQP